MKPHKKLKQEIQIGDDTLIIETGHVARQADGSCMLRLGDTVVLTTACSDDRDDKPRDFLPLTVDYREWTSAGGRIPGGFFKREGRPTEKEIITSRLTDRPLRPLFPEGFFRETQIISFVLSADGENDPDVLAINGASTALVLSEIPFYHPVAAVRVGMVDGEMVFNPTNSQRDVADLDLMVVGTEEAVVMVEAACNQVSEQVLLDCIFGGHEELQKVIRAQHQLYRECGHAQAGVEPPEEYPPALYQQVKADLYEPLKQALRTRGKFTQKDAIKAVTKPYLDAIPEGEEVRRVQVKKALKAIEAEILGDVILGENQRLDGRALDQIRPIAIDIGLLPRTHGSAVFTRGETQALVTATLGTSRDAQIIEEYEGESKQKFLLHYNFPPFSVGEVKFLRGPGRREIGHGVLARRALHAGAAPRGRLRLHRSASSPTSWSRTARRRWPPSAAARWRCSTPACRSWRRSRASRWA